VKKLVSGILLAFAVAATPALATDTTYFYGGKINPTNSRDGGIVNYVDLHAPMTFEFTVAAPLAANLLDSTITGSVLSWTASAGKPTSTIASTYPQAQLGRLRLSTNALGVITNWNIVASATNPALGTHIIQGLPYGISPEFYFENDGGGDSDSVRFYENAYSQNTGGAICSGTCGGQASRGSFTLVQPIVTGGVPEPASWVMLIAGFGVIGGIKRRRGISGNSVAV
jgi:hypothetical protein